LRTGPFVVHVQSDVGVLAQGLGSLYGDFPLAETTEFADLHVSLTRPHSVRRWVRPQVNFYMDGESTVNPLPLEQAMAMFEWNLNWSLYYCAQHYLVAHAATVEQNGFAAIMPGQPGTGKSTLCAGLIHSGWRLITDEMTLIDRETSKVVPLARPVTLKNESIRLIKKFAPEAVFGPESPNTVKGAIAHLKPPTESVLRVEEKASPRWLIFPKYQAGSPTEVLPISKATAFMELTAATLNYPFLGVEDFHFMCRIIDRLDCFQLRYSGLEEAVAWFQDLATCEATPKSIK